MFILKELVDEQSQDDGLWAQAETIMEKYLQQALRILHGRIEKEYHRWENHDQPYD